MSWDDPTGAGMIGAVPGNAPVTDWDDDDDEDIGDIADNEGPLVKGAWDDSSSDEEQPAEVKPKKKKGPTKAEKLAAKRRKREQMIASSDEEETELDRERRRLQVERADLMNAVDLFEGVEGAATFESSDPRTHDDFTVLADLIIAKIQPYQRSGHYVNFLEKIVRETAAELEVADVRKLEKVLSVMGNEKQKEQREARKGKKKKKKAAKVKMERSDAFNTDEVNFEEDFAEFDGFM